MSSAISRASSARVPLWACYPDASAAGADLLSRIAKVIDAPVVGPTGLIYCGIRPNLYLGDRVKWQTATPTMSTPPHAIDPPDWYPLGEKVMELKLSYDGQLETISLDDVNHVDFTSGISLDPNFRPTDEKSRISFSGAAMRGLLQLVRFDQPFQPGGIPGSLVTGRITISFMHNEAPEERTFILYSYLLLQDVTAPDTFYNCHPSFRDALHMFR